MVGVFVLLPVADSTGILAFQCYWERFKPAYAQALFAKDHSRCVTQTSTQFYRNSHDTAAPHDTVTDCFAGSNAVPQVCIMSMCSRAPTRLMINALLHQSRWNPGKSHKFEILGTTVPLQKTLDVRMLIWQ
jgi:hypothetical protein